MKSKQTQSHISKQKNILAPTIADFNAGAFTNVSSKTVRRNMTKAETAEIASETASFPSSD